MFRQNTRDAQKDNTKASVQARATRVTIVVHEVTTSPSSVARFMKVLSEISTVLLPKRDVLDDSACDRDTRCE